MTPKLSRFGLSSLNFFTAAVQTGFGPFVSVWLIKQGWSQIDIGVALSIGTFAALLGQLPMGWLIDAIDRKRAAIAVALVSIGISALALAWIPARWPVLSGQVVHGLASCTITPAIAAITLRMCGHTEYSLRLGLNGRFASLGSASAAVLLGLAGWYISEEAVFVATALLVIPALVSVASIHPNDCAEGEQHHAVLKPRERRQRHGTHPWDIFREPALHVFAGCAVLFFVANAAILPLTLNVLALRNPDTGLIISAAILLPQLVAAAISPRLGMLAQRLGRRPVLLTGFAIVPLRGLLFAGLTMIGPDAVPVILVQTLDGISASVFGLMVPLIAADVTRHSGYLNLAIGSLGFAVGLGATISTTLAGWIADTAGVPTALLALASAGGLALAVMWLIMPETRPDEVPPGTVAVPAG